MCSIWQSNFDVPDWLTIRSSIYFDLGCTEIQKPRSRPKPTDRQRELWCARCAPMSESYLCMKTARIEGRDGSKCKNRTYERGRHPNLFRAQVVTEVLSSPTTGRATHSTLPNLQSYLQHLRVANWWYINYVKSFKKNLSSLFQKHITLNCRVKKWSECELSQLRRSLRSHSIKNNKVSKIYRKLDYPKPIANSNPIKIIDIRGRHRSRQSGRLIYVYNIWHPRTM